MVALSYVVTKTSFASTGHLPLDIPRHERPSVRRSVFMSTEDVWGPGCVGEWRFFFFCRQGKPERNRGTPEVVVGFTKRGFLVGSSCISSLVMTCYDNVFSCAYQLGRMSSCTQWESIYGLSTKLCGWPVHFQYACDNLGPIPQKYEPSAGKT